MLLIFGGGGGDKTEKGGNMGMVGMWEARREKWQGVGDAKED